MCCSGRESRRLQLAPARPRTTSPGVRRAAPERHLGCDAAARVRGTRTGAEGSCSGLETQGRWKPTGTTGHHRMHDARVPGDPLPSCEKPLRKTLMASWSVSQVQRSLISHPPLTEIGAHRCQHTESIFFDAITAAAPCGWAPCGHPAPEHPAPPFASSRE